MTADVAVQEREILTPEGVPLRFVIAPAGDRLAALLTDVAILLGILAGLGFLVLLATIAIQPARDLGWALMLLASFLVRAFYFPYFEIAWQGQTPGKRRMRIRAIDARGGPLSSEAILARNMTRELEIFLPIVALTGASAVFPGAPALARVASLVWMVVFGFMPLFNRDRMRVGDLIAGTVVVRVPDPVLLPDLAASAPAPAAEAFEFTAAQLDVYGEYELQVLEQVLRSESTETRAQSVRAISAKIRAKIGWEGSPGDDLAFLTAFYAAQRGRLERSLVFGRRRRHKGDRTR